MPMSDEIRMIKLIDSLSDNEYLALLDILLKNARKEMNATPSQGKQDLDKLLEKNFLKENR